MHIKVWAWYPNMAKVVGQLQQAHNDVQVGWCRPAQGQDEYTKFQTAISAEKGAPDVVMLEFQELPAIRDPRALVDMGKFGANDGKEQLQRLGLEGGLRRRPRSTRSRSTAARWR